MKKILSVLIMSILLTSGVFADNEIDISKINIISKGEKIVNNMKCNYVEMGNYYSIQNATFLEVFEDNKLIYKGINFQNNEFTGKYSSYDLETEEIEKLEKYTENKQNIRKIISSNVKQSKLKYYGDERYKFFEDGKEKGINQYLEGNNEIYNSKSSSIPFYKSIKMGGVSGIIKDGMYIYEATNPKYYTNGDFGFTYQPDLEDRLFIFYGCKNIITIDYQIKLNKALNDLYKKIEAKFYYDYDNTEEYLKKVEERNQYYNNLIEKIELNIEKSKSKKTKFLLGYIKESCMFFRDNKNTIGIGESIDINSIGVSDFIY